MSVCLCFSKMTDRPQPSAFCPLLVPETRLVLSLGGELPWRMGHRTLETAPCSSRTRRRGLGPGFAGRAYFEVSVERFPSPGAPVTKGRPRNPAKAAISNTGPRCPCSARSGAPGRTPGKSALCVRDGARANAAHRRRSRARHSTGGQFAPPIFERLASASSSSSLSLPRSPAPRRVLRGRSDG